MPQPLREGSYVLEPLPADLNGKHRAKPAHRKREVSQLASMLAQVDNRGR
jgi:hypothetical protein